VNIPITLLHECTSVSLSSKQDQSFTYQLVKDAIQTLILDPFT